MISYEEAQELHLLVGGPIEAAMDRYDIAGAKPDFVMVKIGELERARELVALIVTDTDPDNQAPDTSINVYFTGDEDGPDLFGVVHDDEDSVLESAHENEVHGWRVPVQPLLDRAVRLDGDDDE